MAERWRTIELRPEGRPRPYYFVSKPLLHSSALSPSPSLRPEFKIILNPRILSAPPIEDQPRRYKTYDFGAKFGITTLRGGTSKYTSRAKRSGWYGYRVTTASRIQTWHSYPHWTVWGTTVVLLSMLACFRLLSTKWAGTPRWFLFFFSTFSLHFAS